VIVNSQTQPGDFGMKFTIGEKTADEGYEFALAFITYDTVSGTYARDLD
jgi:hypothetical protein